MVLLILVVLNLVAKIFVDLVLVSVVVSQTVVVLIDMITDGLHQLSHLENWLHQIELFDLLLELKLIEYNIEKKMFLTFKLIKNTLVKNTLSTI